MTRLPWTLCAGLAAMVALAGCVPTRPASPPAAALPTPPDFSGTLSASAVDLATRSGTWPASQELLDATIHRLDQKCLAAQGFEYPDMAAAALPAPEDEAAIIDLAGRRSHGYGLASGAAQNPGNEPRDDFYARLSPARQRRFDVALFGPPGRTVKVGVGGGQVVTVNELGCEADSRRRLMGDVALWARVRYASERLDDQLTDQATTTPMYLAALATWRSCMDHRGYRYQSPDAALNAMHDQQSAAGFRQREIAVAVADGECAAQAHLPATILRASRDLATSLPLLDRKALADLAFYRDAAVRRATATTGTDHVATPPARTTASTRHQPGTVALAVGDGVGRTTAERRTAPPWGDAVQT